jgi:hypothetical protein
MSRHVYVRPSTPKDFPLFSKWLEGTKDNLFDPAVFTYKGTTAWCAYNKSGPLVFMPAQRPFMMESLAINPDASEIDIAIALKELFQAMVLEAHKSGEGEIYFLCSQPETIAFAKKHEFLELPERVFRVRLSDLEAQG